VAIRRSGDQRKKVWRGFRKLDYRDDEKMRVRAQLLEKLKRIIHEGRHEAEQGYGDFLKQLMPNLSKEDLQERIRQFHDAVSDAQARDQESR
jgi:hypothetical protein